jgi:hypothetical protein
MSHEDPLRDLLADLPREIEPSRDLWSGIEARLDVDELALLAPANDPAPPWWRRGGGLALAAVLLVSLTAGATAWLVRPDAPVEARPDLASVEAPQEPVAPEAAPAVPWQQQMQDASDDLYAALEARRGELDPAVVVVVEENLRLIDQAIMECSLALEANPTDPRLEGVLADTWRRKIELLERARDLPAGS